jgi:hypothetical protein
MLRRGRLNDDDRLATTERSVSPPNGRHVPGVFDP